MHVFKRTIVNFQLLTRSQKAVIVGIVTFMLFPLLHSLGLLPALNIFYINTTKSAPLGVYIAALDQRLYTGDYVVMDVPEEMKPYLYGRGWAMERENKLLKQIAGLATDSYKIEDNRITINRKTAFIHTVDHENLPLPKPENGNYIIPVGKFMPVSLDRDNSFDARYTGPVEESLITKKVIPILVLPLCLEKYI